MPLKEGHAATRSRWTANTLTVSDFEDRQTPPPLELMFKAAGLQLQGRLQQHVAQMRCPWLSVVTGPKGSYREEHVADYLERHLPSMSPGRRWKILLLDAYRPQMSESIRKLAWNRGFVVLIVGGGCTAIVQVNDTDLHQHLRRLYTELESADLMRQARLNPGATPIPKPENCIGWMTKVWLKLDLHRHAASGFKSTGITCALDGSEDQMMTREARTMWDALGMAKLRDEAVIDVQQEAEAGNLAWDYESVFSVVEEYPATGHMDVTEEFQDDEDVLEDGADPWAESSDDASEEEEGAVHSAPVGEPVPLPLVESVSGGSLGTAQADEVLDHLSRIVAIRNALEAMAPMKHEFPSLMLALQKSMQQERRHAEGRYQEDPEVAKAVHAVEVQDAEDRLREQLSMERRIGAAKQAKQDRDLAREVEEAKALLVKKRGDIEHHEALLDTLQHFKSFSPDMLGAGKKNGGTLAHRRNRMEVLDRLARNAPLSPQQKNDWSMFKHHWDSVMQEQHDDAWGSTFASMAQGVLEKLQAGEATALSTFMYEETKRWLQHVPFIVV